MIQNLTATNNKFNSAQNAVSKNSVQMGKSIYDREESELITNPLFRNDH